MMEFNLVINFAADMLFEALNMLVNFCMKFLTFSLLGYRAIPLAYPFW